MATYSQANRKLRVSTPLGGDALLLERFAGEEGLSTPFLFTLDMVSENPDVDPEALLRKPVCVSVVLPDDSERFIHGRIRRFVQLGRTDALTSYRAEVVPWLWFLSLGSDCRIFQQMSVPEIVEQVFGDLGFSDFSVRTSGTYAKRDYCVQYRETHLDFVSRLLEEEGIFYFFEHASDKHTLVLADATSAIRPCPGQERAPLREGGGYQDADVVRSVMIERAARTGKVALTDYNFETPFASLAALSSGDAPEERYDFPGSYGERDAGDRYARLQLEAHETGVETLRGTSSCRAFQSGYRFTLQDHYRREANKAYTLVRVRHEAGSGGFAADGGDTFDYQNEFECIPHAVPYRPLRDTPRPIVHGSQTAVVVGPSGEEIYVDKYGRVKVQFHWDRKGQKNESSSCWMRVASTWAGKNWGFIQIPRIGQEVIVDFLEGDPDQPIVTGRVYNADQMPPYALPANGTQSGLKTRSSKQGGEANFNELRFEDKKGSEEVYLHAEKDWNTMVEHDHTRTVGNDETLTVKHDRTRLVEHDEKVTVKNDRTKTIEHDETITVQNDRSATIQHDDTLTISNKLATSVGMDESRSVGGKRETSVSMDDKLDVGMNLEHKASMNGLLDAGMNLTLQAGMNLELKAGVSIKLTAGASSIELGPAGITIQGAPKVAVQGAAQVSVQGGMVEIVGGLVKIN